MVYVFSHTFCSTYFLFNAFMKVFLSAFQCFCFPFVSFCIISFCPCPGTSFPCILHIRSIHSTLQICQQMERGREHLLCVLFMSCSSRPTVSQSSRCLWVIRTTCQLVHSHLSHSDRCGVLDTVIPLQCVCVCVCVRTSNE